MTALYNISVNYQNAFQIDEETGEINMVHLDRIEEDFKKKAISIASHIKNMEYQSQCIEDAIKNMRERKERLDNQVLKLTDYIKTNMEICNIQKIEDCEYFSIKLKKCPLSVSIQDESLINEKYLVKKEILSISKSLIKEDIEKGEEVSGAKLVSNIKLCIK